MPDLRIDHGEVVVDGDYAAAVWTATGTDTGGVLGAAPTGAEASWGGINVFRFECGKIAEVWSEMDVVGLREQLGTTP